jgi:hypothetical protein
MPALTTPNVATNASANIIRLNIFASRKRLGGSREFVAISTFDAFHRQRNELQSTCQSLGMGQHDAATRTKVLQGIFGEPNLTWRQYVSSLRLSVFTIATVA